MWVIFNEDTGWSEEDWRIEDYKEAKELQRSLNLSDPEYLYGIRWED